MDAGFDYKNFGYRTQKLGRTNGSTATMDSWIPTELENAPLSSITDVYHLTGMTAPGATATSWVTPSVDKLVSQFHIYDQTAFPLIWPANSTAPANCQVAPGCSAFALGPGQFLTQNGSIRENDDFGLGNGRAGIRPSGACPSAAISVFAMPPPTRWGKATITTRMCGRSCR